MTGQMQDNFNKRHFTIRYDQTNHVLVHKWMIPTSSDEFRDGMEALIKAIDHYKTGKLIMETTYLGIVLPSDRFWVATEWLGKALFVGFTQGAFLLPRDEFAKKIVKDTFDPVKQAASIATFEKPQDATDWIRQFG